MDSAHCFIHYERTSISGKLRPITNATLKTLKQNKSVRINLGGDNLHELQSVRISPSIFACAPPPAPGLLRAFSKTSARV